MLKLSKKTDYALMAMAHLASHGGLSSVSARQIAGQYAIPVELLAKVLQRLVQQGLLASHQGIRGGYQLARSSQTISVAQVIEAIEGPLTLTACSETDGGCDQYERCNVRDPLWRIKDRLRSALADCSIADIASESADDHGERVVWTSSRSRAATAERC